MKRLKYISTILLALLMAFFVVGCTRIAPLDTPTGFNFDERLNMYWTYVPAARSYTLDINGVDNRYHETMTSHVTHVSLEHLTEGDYEIKVMAVGGMNNRARSAWSPIIDFHRDRESGIAFTAINGNTEYAVSGIGTATGTVEIEAVYRGKPVTEVAEDAFRGKGSSKLQSVTLGENIRTIGNSAFYNCTNLTEVVIPDSVTSIGTNLFQGCSNLKTVAFPEGITSIPAYTFAYCRALEEFTIGEAVTSIGESAFYSCSALKAIDIPDTVTYIGQHAFDADKALESVSIGSGISTIADYAFYSCSVLTDLTFEPVESLSIGAHAFDACAALTRVRLPDGLTSMGNYAFYRCTLLKDVNIPDTVTSIGVFAFRDTAIFNEQCEVGSDGYVSTKAGHDGFIYVDDWIVGATDEFKLSVTMLGSSNMRNGVVGIADQTFVVNAVTSTGLIQTVGAPALTEVTLIPSIKYIGVYAFYKCGALNKVSASAGSQLVSIGDRAFQECSALRNVQFQNNLLDIGSYAFYKCLALMSSTQLVPSSVQRVGTYAFFGTSFWDSAAEGDGIVYAGNWVVGFNNLVNTAVVLKSGVVGISDFAFYENTEIRTLNGLSSARYIGRGAFFGCSSLSQISLNATLTEIADNTFSGCSSLFLATLPLRLERIGLRAFYQCTLLDKIDLSETMVTEVGDMAFYGCTNVKSINLGSRLKYIGDSAFYENKQVTELTIPDSVKEIGMHAFAYCEKLETLSLGSDASSLERIGAGAFQGCTALQSVALPDSVKSVGSYTFYSCPNLANVDFGNGIEEIGKYAFAANALASVNLPESVKVIGDYAFKNCKQLTSVILNGSPEYIGVHAFYGDTALTIYSLGEGASSDWSSRWNSSFRPVIWSCTLGDDGTYIASFTTSFDTVSNPRARGGFSAPVREGYDFVGWALEPDGDAVYGADDWRNAPFGTTLYSVWSKRADAIAS